MLKIAALIISYNPDIPTITSIVDFLDKFDIFTLIVDNDSHNKDELNFANMIIEKSNVGIGKALNDGVKFLERVGYDWVLTLDQDSVLSPDYFVEISKIKIDKETAVLAPVIQDINNRALNQKKRSNVLEKNLRLPIQSGAFIRIKDYFIVGGMDEDLFIDGVDFDFFLELVSQGKKIIFLNQTVLFQNFGEHKEVSIFGHYLFSTLNYSSIRYYYSYRNMPLLVKRHNHILNNEFSIHARKWLWETQTRRAFKMLIGEKDKIEKIKAIALGIKDSHSLITQRKN